MNIAIIGYGKMGKTIESIAIARDHTILVRVDKDDELPNLINKPIDIAIEFSQPDTGFQNVKYCIENNIPVISGTTGWTDKYEEITQLCQSVGGTFMYASNFSISVNLFFELNKWLADRLKHYDYKVSLEEIHHTEKKDTPSGTAITLAEGIIENNDQYKSWTNENLTDKTKIPIVSKREANYPGTHSVTYSSPLETISINHTANNRKIFAEGAVLVAEWIKGKKGVFTMSDFIQNN